MFPKPYLKKTEKVFESHWLATDALVERVFVKIQTKSAQLTLI